MKHAIVKRAAAGCAALLLALAGAASAQSTTYPEKRPVRIINAYPAGGTSDTIARVIADNLSRAWGTSVVVENRPGATGFIAAEAGARAAPDGHTILMIDPTIMSMNPALFSRMPYDPARDFVPVVNVSQFSCVLVAAPGFAASTLAEAVAAARARPGEVNYASSGVGSFTHLYHEEFNALAGVKMTHVPYKGNAEVVKAVLGGEVQLTLSGALAVAPLVKQGKLKAIAIAADKREPLLPDVPTFKEAGIPFTCAAWVGLALPAATPRPIVAKLAEDVGRIIATREFSEKYIGPLALELINQGPEAFSAFLKDERSRYEAYVRRVNVRLD